MTVSVVARQSSARVFSVEFLACSGIAALLVVSTFFLEYRQIANESVWLPFLPRQFHLGYENNLAAWFSGTLLALGALHAMDGHTRFREGQPRAAQAWAIIAGILFFLSADEIGSLHERLGLLGEAMGVGNWGPVLPVGAALGALLLRALTLLWTAERRFRRQVCILMTGFALLGSVALQEFLGDVLVFEGPLANAIRTSVEEGTELVGMLIVLGVALGSSAELLERRQADRVFAALIELRWWLVGALVVLTPAATIMTLSVEEAFRGRPADWLAAMAFLAAAALAIRHWICGGGGPGLLAGGLLVLASALCLMIGPEHIVGSAYLAATKRAILLVPLVLLTVALAALGGFMSLRPARLAAPLGLCLALSLAAGQTATLVTTIGLGAVVFLDIATKRPRDD